MGETVNPVVFCFTRSDETDLSKSVTVYYTFSGTATCGQDYSLASGCGSYNASNRYGTVTIPANQSLVNITLSKSASRWIST